MVAWKIQTDITRLKIIQYIEYCLLLTSANFNFLTEVTLGLVEGKNPSC